MPKRPLISEKELAAVLQLDGEKRYRHIIKGVADWEVGLGLWQDGWALAEDNDGRIGFPVWPAREYAEVAGWDVFPGHEPAEVAVADLLDELRHNLRGKGYYFAVFPTPSGRGVYVEPDRLAEGLKEELRKYGHDDE